MERVAPPPPPRSEAASKEVAEMSGIERSELLKNIGNQKLKHGLYKEAIQVYSEAIVIHETAVLYSNRSMAHIKEESYGLAIADAELALELDPQYVKAYYRRGSGLFALHKYKQALKDFKHVCRLQPKDPQARRQYAECEKQAKEAAFARAIESEETAPFALDSARINVDGSYEGPRIETEDGSVTLEFVHAMVEYFKDQKMIHRKFVVIILNQIIEQLAALPNCMDLRVPEDDNLPFTVCGDVHGQFYDLLNIFAVNGEPSDERPYLFNGDFVDRGSFSLEVILTLFAYKLVTPKGVNLSRGNHESKNMNKIYGFEGEVKHKLDMDIARLFTVAFCNLPLCATIESKIFVVHGGLASENGVRIADINRLDRVREPPECGLMCDLLWSDPQPMPGRSPSKRGIGLSFGPDVTDDFLETNGLDLVVRSHEVRDEGFEWEHGNRLVTVFSAPNYCDQMGNKGAFLHFKRNDGLTPNFLQFTHVPHPPIRPMQYASALMQ